MKRKNKMSYKNFLKRKENKATNRKNRNQHFHPRESGFNNVRSSRNITVRRNWTNGSLKSRVLRNFNDQHFRKEHNLQFLDQEGSDVLISLKFRGTTYVFVRVRDYSTSEYHLLSVPEEMKRVRQAIAWTFGLTEEEYQLAKQT